MERRRNTTAGYCMDCPCFKVKSYPVKKQPGQALCRKYNFTVDYNSKKMLHRIMCKEGMR